jgi:2,3-bisphosphoglycerate-independent phosphoglycerate mutase
MRYIVIVGDGMADYPLEELGGKTPLQVADKPNIDEVAKRGSNGLLRTIPEGFEAGSDVANLSILGYDPNIYYPGGRGPIEAASQGIQMEAGDLAFRANIISVKEGRIWDYSAGHIKNSEAKELLREANKAFGGRGVEFHSGISYRNLLILRDTPLEPEEFICNAPHDNIGGEVEDLLIRGDKKSQECVDHLNECMIQSQELFEKHPLNAERRRQGKPLANMLWFWGPGKKRREMPTLKDRFGWTGVVISGVDLIKGLGVLAGLRVVNVLGATAYFDTNYEGKADAALEALKTDDIALIHIEAPDEAGHEGLIEEKIKAIENIDKRVVGRIMDRMEGDYKLGFLCDHPTPIRVRTHVWDPVPFAIMGGASDSVDRYDEKSARKGAYGLRKGSEFIELMASDE